MKVLRFIGSFAFVAGLFTVIFIGIPWHVMTSKDPVVPLWLQVAVFSFLGGFLLVMLSIAVENLPKKQAKKEGSVEESLPDIVIQTSAEIPGKEVTDVLGLVQGHTVFAIWIGNDLSAIVRLILGGELTEYTEMMGKARQKATTRMIKQAGDMGADAIINVRYMTTSVVGSAAELLTYGTAVKLKNAEK